MNGICERENCFGHDNKKYKNKCNVLVETYEDDFECPFFKTEEQVANERRNRKRFNY